MSFIHRNSITFPSGNIPQFNARQMRRDILLTLLPTNRSDEKTCWRGKLRTFFEGLHICDIGVGASGQKKNIEQDRSYEFHGYPCGNIYFSHIAQGMPTSWRWVALISNEKAKYRRSG